jgi:hypothetical protein
MSSTSLVRSAYPADWAAESPSRRRKRPSGGFSRFLTTFCMGIVATLAWQSYSDAMREMLADAYPQLDWVAPRAAAAKTAPTAASTRSADSREIQELSQSLAAMRQRVDQLAVQLAAGQDQMTRDIAAKVAMAERDILDRIATGQPRAEVTAAAARKPAPQTQLQLH